LPKNGTRFKVWDKVPQYQGFPKFLVFGTTFLVRVGGGQLCEARAGLPPAGHDQSCNSPAAGAAEPLPQRPLREKKFKKGQTAAQRRGKKG